MLFSENDFDYVLFLASLGSTTCWDDSCSRLRGLIISIAELLDHAAHRLYRFSPFNYVRQIMFFSEDSIKLSTFLDCLLQAGSCNYSFWCPPRAAHHRRAAIIASPIDLHLPIQIFVEVS